MNTPIKPTPISQSKPSAKIFIGSLPGKTTRLDLQQYFSVFGWIKSIRIAKKGSRCKGFATMVFKYESSLEKLRKTESPLKIHGRHIFVEEFLSGKNLHSKHMATNSKRVFIKRLSTNLTDLDLQLAFSSFGEIESAYRLVTILGEQKTFGFVSFKELSSVRRCLEQKYVFINGCKVQAVKFQKPSGETATQFEKEPRNKK